MKIIIKVDDWWGTSSLSVPGFKKFLDVCRLFSIKIELGVIGLGLGNNPEIARDFLNDNNWVNVYNHSFYHFINETAREFYLTDKQYQRDSIFKTQLAIAQGLGRICQVIGFPANAFDYNTIEIMKEFPLIKYVFAYPYGKLYNNIKELEKVGYKIIDVNGYKQFEYPPRIISLDDFTKTYSNDKDYIVYQFHPVNYNDEDIYNFSKIIEFLINKGNTFVFASEI